MTLPWNIQCSNRSHVSPMQAWDCPQTHRHYTLIPCGIYQTLLLGPLYQYYQHSKTGTCSPIKGHPDYSHCLAHDYIAELWCIHHCHAHKLVKETWYIWHSMAYPILLLIGFIHAIVGSSSNHMYCHNSTIIWHSPTPHNVVLFRQHGKGRIQ